MRDHDIRKYTLQWLRRVHQRDPDTLMVEELGLHFGDARADIAVVNGALHGIEIKSDHDTFRRLPKQARIYGAILDTVTLVCTGRHLPRAERDVPAWWGITAASRANAGAVRLSPIRPALQNQARDPLAVVSLLWRDEALSLLERHGAAKGARSKARPALHQRLVEILPLDDLATAVRSAIKARNGWRAAPPSTRCGDSC